MRLWLEEAISIARDNLRWSFWTIRVGLIASICYLVFTIAHGGFSPAEIGDAGLTGSDSTFSVVLPQHRSRGTLSQYTATLNQRNVFGQSTTRRTATARSDNAENIRSVLERYQILGVVWGQKPTAILLDKSTQSTMTVEIGEMIGQLEVVAIERDFVRFQLLGETYDAKY